MYPVFIPIKSRGGPFNKIDAILLLGVIGGLYGVYNYITHPHIKITKNNNDLIMNIHRNNLLDFKIIDHHNIECLKNKGYYVYTSTNRVFYSLHMNYKLASIHNITNNKFREDCKSCNAYTSIYYTTPSLGTFPKEHTKNIYWKDYEENKSPSFSKYE